MNRIKATEHQEQSAFFQYCDLKAIQDRRWNNIFAIPNQGRDRREMGRYYAREGLRSGVPDIFIAVPIFGNCECGRKIMIAPGKFLETKTATGKVSENQKNWLEKLSTYSAEVCRGTEELILKAEKYLK